MEQVQVVQLRSRVAGAKELDLAEPQGVRDANQVADMKKRDAECRPLG